MKGDYYRYLAEVATGETRNSKYLLRASSVCVVFVYTTWQFCVFKVVDKIRAHTYTVEAAYYITDNVISLLLLIKISGPKTLHLKSIKTKPCIIINLSVIVIKLQTI
jgi:hypothetical protein